MPRIIQVPIDDELLGKLDTLSDKQGQSRAALIREACRQYVVEKRKQELDEQYAEGYRRIPETTEMGEAQEAMLADVLEPEEW